MQSNRLYLRPINSSSESKETKNYIKLSAKHRSDDKKIYIAKITPDSQMYSPTYYPVKFDDSIQKINFSLGKHVYNYTRFLNSNVQQIELIDLDANNIVAADSMDIEIKRISKRDDKDFIIRKDKLIKIIQQELIDFPLAMGQILSIQLNNDVTIDIEIHRISNTTGHNYCFLIGPETKFNFTKGPAAKCMNIITDNMPTEFTLDFKSRGIGGNHEELEQLVREAFYSRAMGSEFAKAYGTSHTRGVLISGPPGTGKTLIVKEIVRSFTQNGKEMGKVTVINGPELKNRYVGQSEENLRMVFARAINDWERNGENSDLYVFIFDEIDALLPERGSRSGGTGVDDDMVAQFLTILDGVNSPKNILVFGLTNRKKLIDKAALRPGRFSVHIKVKLPNEQDRLEILSIKTATLKENNLLDDSVNLDYWAKETKNYTGAELEELVKKANHYAMGGNFDFSSGQKSLILKQEIKDIENLQKVTKEHFNRAFKDILPAFGVEKSIFNFDKSKFIQFNTELTSIIEEFNSSLHMLRKNKDLDRLTFLIDGESGTGKTDLAKYLAQSSGANYIKVISGDKLLGLSLPQQLNYLEEVFSDTQHSELSVIILDDLENILLADAEQTTYSNAIRLKLTALLKEYNETSNQQIIIATTRSKEFLRKMQLLDLFNETKTLNCIHLNYSNTAEISKVLSPISKVMHIQLVMDEKPIDTKEQNISITIKDLIYKIKKFCSGSKNPNELPIHKFYQFLQQETLPRHFNDEIEQLRSDVQSIQLSSGLFKPKFGS